MQRIRFGRRRLSFGDGKMELLNTSITIRSLPGENEQAFTERLMKDYCEKEGTIEIVFKGGHPDYAIVTNE